MSTFNNTNEVAIYDGKEDGLTYVEKRGEDEFYAYNDNFDMSGTAAELKFLLEKYRYTLIAGSF